MSFHTVDTTNVYDGDQLQQTERMTKAQFADGTGDATTTEQRDCFAYNVFGSQTQTYRQTKKDGTTIQGCGTEPTEIPGKLEVRSVYDTFERLTAGRERKHEKADKTDEGTLDGTQAFCFDPFDRRDRRLSGLTGAADPAGSNQSEEGRTRADAACRTAATGDVKAFDYSYLGQTEQLTRENRGGQVQSYEYTAAGERLGRLKIEDGKDPQWRSYDVDAQGTVVGLESDSTGYATPEDRYDTDPFGSPIADETKLSGDAKANPFRFQGFYKDQETGTYDMQARSYRPDQNRFLQQDRFESATADLALASDPFTNSRYAFTAGNPGTRSEYNGHCWGGVLDTFRAFSPGLYSMCRQLRSSLRKSMGNAGSQLNRSLDLKLGERRKVKEKVAATVKPRYPEVEAKDVTPTPGGRAYLVSRADATQNAIVKPGGGGYQVAQAWSSPADNFKMTPGTFWKEFKGKVGTVAKAALMPDCRDPVSCFSSLPTPAKLLRGKKVVNAIEEAGDAGSDVRRARRGAICASGRKSFGPGTLVSMADGSKKRISDINVGDEVLTSDFSTGKARAGRVSRVWSHYDELYLVNIDGHLLESTEDHPVWNDTANRWESLDKLSPRDRVSTTRGSVVGGTRIDWSSRRQGLAYNLSVDTDHNYYVGKTAVLVHNCTPVDVLQNPSKHLRYDSSPQELLEKLGGVPDGWEITGLGGSSRIRGKGFKLQEMNGRGGTTGRQIRYHPGGPRHGPDPYWTVTSGEFGIMKVKGPRYKESR